jgi:hypothetical protein
LRALTEPKVASSGAAILLVEDVQLPRIDRLTLVKSDTTPAELARRVRAWTSRKEVTTCLSS